MKTLFMRTLANSTTTIPRSGRPLARSGEAIIKIRPIGNLGHGTSTPRKGPQPIFEYPRISVRNWPATRRLSTKPTVSSQAESGDHHPLFKLWKCIASVRRKPNCLHHTIKVGRPSHRRRGWWRWWNISRYPRKFRVHARGPSHLPVGPRRTRASGAQAVRRAAIKKGE